MKRFLFFFKTFFLYLRLYKKNKNEKDKNKKGSLGNQ
jgi:hypothetical protein